MGLLVNVRKTETQDEKETVSDVALILQFIANLLKDETASASVVKKSWAPMLRILAFWTNRQ